MKLLAPVKAVQRQLKNRSFKEKLLYFVSLSGSPEHLAASFGIGIFIGFCPLYGIHTVFAFIIAYMFRLNMPALMFGAWLNFPFIAPVVYFTCYQVGRFLSFGNQQIPFEVLLDTFINIAHFRLSEIPLDSSDLMIFIAQLTIGTTLIGLLSGITGYYCLRNFIRLHRQRKERLSESV